MSFPVVVNFDVNVDAQHGVVVFEDSPADIFDKVICATTLPVEHLYVGDAANEALFEFQGVDDAINGRRLVGPTSFGTDARKAAFTTALQAILTNDSNLANALNAENAQPFDDAGKAYATDFKQYKSFGRLALATYAHHLFGHVQATAAISNDTAIINFMNGEGETDAKICSDLVNQIYTASDATAIAKQVIGQDATRATEVDNDLTSPDSWQRLKWFGGDKIYVQVTLKRPTTVNVADGTADVQQYIPSANSLPELGIKYSFEITLSSEL